MKRIFSLFLSLVLLFGCLPMNVMAEDAAAEPTPTPAPTAEPVPTTEPEPTPTPTAEPTPTPTAEPTPTTEPTPTPSTEPEPTATPAADDGAAKVAAVQALADALPTEITADMMDAVGARLNAFIAAYGELDAEQQAQVDTSRYEACMAAMYELMGMAGAQNPAPVADWLYTFDVGTNKDVDGIELYAINDNGVRQTLTSGENVAAKGFSRGESYPITIDPSSGYMLLWDTMDVPENSSTGDQPFRVKVTKKTALTVIVQDSMGNPLSGKTVRLSESLTSSGTTDADGKVVFENLRGIFTLAAHVDYTKASGGTATVSSDSVYMNNENKTITLTIPAEMSFSVRVMGKKDGAVVDSDVSAATVTVTNENGDSTKLSHGSNGSYTGSVLRSKNGEETFTIAVTARGYDTADTTVTSSNGAAVSKDIDLTLKELSVSGIDTTTVQTGTTYAVALDLNTVPEEATPYFDASSEYFRVTGGSDGSWTIMPIAVYQGTQKVMVGYGIENNIVPVTYDLTCTKGQAVYPAAPTLTGGNENVSAQSFTVPALPAISSLTIKASGVAEKEQTFADLKGGETLALDFGSTLKGTVSYSFTYSSDQVEYTGSQPAAVNRSYYKTFTAEDVSLSATALAYNGQAQAPTVSVDGFAAGEYMVKSGVYCGEYFGFQPEDTVKPFEIHAEEKKKEFGLYFGQYYAVRVTGKEEEFIRGSVIVKYDIVPRPITVTAKDQEITYGEQINKNLYTVSGLLNGHKMESSVSAATLEAPGGDITVGEVKITDSSGADMAAYYSVTRVSGELTVKPAELKVESVTASKVYDGSDKGADSYHVELSGWLGEDTGTATADITFDSAAVGTGKAITATNIKVDNPNYTVSADSATGTGSITARPLSVEGIMAVDRSYNGSKSVELDLSGMTLDGIVDGEEPEITVSGVMDNADVGTDKRVYLIIVPKDSASCTLSNYDITLQRTAKVNIGADTTAITVTADSDEKEYDGRALTAPGVTVETGSGLSATATADPLVYTLSNGHALSVTLTSDSTITEPGSVDNAIKHVIITNAEGKNVTGYFSGISTVDGTLTVKKNSIPISVTAASGTRYYDAEALSLPVPTVDTELGMTAAKTEGTTTRYTLETGDELRVTVEGEITAPGSVANEVTAFAVYRGTKDVSEFYTLEAPVNGTLTVEANPTPIVITADSAEKVYDAKPLTCLGASLVIGELETPEGYLPAKPIELEKYEFKNGKNYFTLSTGQVLTFTMDASCTITDVQRSSDDAVISVENNGSYDMSGLPEGMSIAECYSGLRREAGRLTVKPYAMKVVINSAKLNRLDDYKKTITDKESPAAKNVSEDPACAYITVTLKNSAGKVITALPGKEILSYTVAREKGKNEPNQVGKYCITELKAVDKDGFKASNYDMLYVYGARYDIVYRFEDLFNDGGVSDQVINSLGRCMWNRYMATPINTRELRTREELLADEEAFLIPLVAEEHYILGETMYYAEDGKLMAEIVFTGNPYAEESVAVDPDSLRVHNVMFGVYRYMPSLYDVDKLSWKKVDQEESKDSEYVLRYDEETELYSLVVDLGRIPSQDWFWVYLSLDAVADETLLNGSFRYHAPNDALDFFWRWNG